MSNWCENVLRVQGPSDEISRFKELACKGFSREPYPLKLEALVPIPEEFLATGQDYANWCIEHWGTKQDVTSQLQTDEDCLLVYSFDSAWSPPDAWLRTVGPMFPQLFFRLWYAEGLVFAGVYLVEGDNVSHEEMDYVTAQIDERGYYATECSMCGGDLEITTVDAELVCEDCQLHRCVNCQKLDTEHAGGKCLFEATTFKRLHEGEERDGS